MMMRPQVRGMGTSWCLRGAAWKQLTIHEGTLCTSYYLSLERVTRFKPDANQPVHHLLKRFNLGWLYVARVETGPCAGRVLAPLLIYSACSVVATCYLASWTTGL